MTIRARLLRVSAVAVVVVFSGVVICLEGVDYQPYFKSTYYTETMQRLQGQATHVNLVTGALSAGFGAARLTPTLGAGQDDPLQGRFRTLPLAGYGERRGKPAVGTHDDLDVKAAAFRVQDRTGVMLAADALIIPREVAELALDRMRRELHLNREQVYFSATHTHSSVGGWGQGKVAEGFAGPFHPGLREWFADRLVAAVREALADLQPASIGTGSLHLPAYVRNRLVGPLGRVDSEFSFIVIRQGTGKVGVIGSYSAHATVLSGRNMEFSADYPGAWRRAVEAATGGTAMFVGGSVASHGPVAGAGGFEGAQRMGQQLAQAVIAQLPQVQFTNVVVFGSLGLEVSLPPLHARLTDGLRLRPWLARLILPVSASTWLEAFRLGNTVWIGTPCDFSGELALAIKDAFRAQGVHPVITSFNGDYIGYVVSSRYYHLPGYEPHWMSFYGPNVPDYLDELIRSLIGAIMSPSAAGGVPVPRQFTD